MKYHAVYHPSPNITVDNYGGAQFGRKLYRSLIHSYTIFPRFFTFVHEQVRSLY